MATTLPPLLLPASCGAFQREGHEIEQQPVYGDAKMQTGAARRRRIYLAAPRVVSVSLEVTQASAADFDAWFTGPLQSGASFFSAQVANQGPGLLWWKARIVGTSSQAPYTAEYLGGIWWKLTFKLILFGAGSDVPPEIPNLTGGVTFDLIGTSTLTVLQLLSGAVIFELLSVTAAASGILAGDASFALLTGTYLPPAPVGTAVGTSTANAVPTSGFVGIAQGGSTALAQQAGWAVATAAGTSGAIASAVVSGLLYPDEKGTFVSSAGPITVGINDIPIYFKRARTLVGVSVLTLGGVGSCILDVYKISLGGYPPSSANSICGSNKPTITSGRTYVDSVLTGWTKAIGIGDTLTIHLDSSSTFTLIAIKLHFTET